jgi:glycosyltransferase involved in cell wall biosynthesis
VAAPASLGSGGLGTAAAEFAAGLESLGVDVEYVGDQPRGPAARLAAGRGFRRAFGAAALRRLDARAVRRAVPAGGWDLVYAASGSVPIGRGSGLLVIHQATRHPTIEWSALRSAERETGGRGDMSAAERRRREEEIERADLIHVTSGAVRDEFLAAGVPEERLVHAYLGVDLERYGPVEKDAEGTKIAFVGPLSLRKGVDVVALLAERTAGEAAVEVVGGPTCPWSRRIVETAPFARRDSVPEMLAGADFLVLPSRSDGFSYVVLEALASGTLPIVTPQVGAAEIVRRLDPRLVVERADFVEAAASLLSELDRAPLRARARAIAEQHDRRRTAPAAAAAVLERATRLSAR